MYTNAMWDIQLRQDQILGLNMTKKYKEKFFWKNKR